MIVCVCNNISDREIAQAVELGVCSMTALRDELGVATCCGSCHDCASEVLEQALADNVGPAAPGRLIQLLISAAA
jgi:bacterioferritin-associated ferredoxin